MTSGDTAPSTLLLLARVKPGAPKPAGAGKLRFIRSCSAPLAPQVMHDLEAAFGAPVLEAYGMTEAAHQMASNPLPENGPRLPGSVGIGTDVTPRFRHEIWVLQDLEAGRPMELEAVVGAVMELGDRLGIAMPSTRAVYACAKMLNDKRIAGVQQ